MGALFTKSQLGGHLSHPDTEKGLEMTMKEVLHELNLVMNGKRDRAYALRKRKELLSNMDRYVYLPYDIREKTNLKVGQIFEEACSIAEGSSRGKIEKAEEVRQKAEKLSKVLLKYRLSPDELDAVDLERICRKYSKWMVWHEDSNEALPGGLRYNCLPTCDRVHEDCSESQKEMRKYHDEVRKEVTKKYLDDIQAIQ